MRPTLLRPARRRAVVGLASATLLLSGLTMMASGASAAAPVATASVVVAPAGSALVEGNSNNGFPWNCGSSGSMRYQQVYAGADIGSGTISRLAWRPEGNDVYRAFGPVTIPGVTVTLSTTSRAPDALQPAYADNIGPDVTTVFSGDLALSSTATGAPRNFDVLLPLQTAFVFDPLAGNLLLDVTIPACRMTTQMDAVSTPGDGTSRLWGFSGTTGTPDTGGLVTQFVMGPVTTMTTSASPATTVGQAVSDTATVTAFVGETTPTGTVTFSLYGPGDTTCTGALVGTSTNALVNGVTRSDDFVATAVGTHRFVAVYSGDADHASSTSPCNAPNESVEVAKASPTIATQATGTVQYGPATISDTATVSMGYNPTGTITFRVYGPDDATCATILTASTAPVDGNGSYMSAPVSPPAVGTYRWIASYSGDANNDPVSGACNDADESSVVTQHVATMTTEATDATVGGTISDMADFTGSAALGGAITFNLYSPSDPTCTGTPVFTSTKPITGTGRYASDPYTTLVAGTYRWIATYAGDANYAPLQGDCDDPAEHSNVAQARPTVTTSAATGVPVGEPISDTATVTGGLAPSGFVTFRVFGPSDPTCAGDPLDTSGAELDGSDNYLSDPYVPTEAGTYRWVAEYEGDENNAATSGECGDAGESSVVVRATPALSTDASDPVQLGGAISDTALLTGDGNPTGVLTFSLYGPDDATCAATPVSVTELAVNGEGAYPSAPFTPTAVGTYRYVASYSGDANNNAVTGACNDPEESTDVTAVSNTGTGGTAPNETPVSPGPPSNAPPSSAPPATPPGCTVAQQNLPVHINTPVINATGLASVSVTGARPGSTIELQGYSQNHYGTMYFDNDPTPIDRQRVADANGAATFNDLRPASNTRVRARELGCGFANALGKVITVRTQLTMQVTRNALRTYTFSGQSIPARPGGLIVSLYRVVGATCLPGVKPADCPGEVLVAQARAAQGNPDGGVNPPGAGLYSMRLSFPAADGGDRVRFVLKTGQDAQNAPGRSNVRSLLIG